MPPRIRTTPPPDERSPPRAQRPRRRDPRWRTRRCNAPIGLATPHRPSLPTPPGSKSALPRLRILSPLQNHPTIPVARHEEPIAAPDLPRHSGHPNHRIDSAIRSIDRDRPGIASLSNCGVYVTARVCLRDVQDYHSLQSCGPIRGWECHPRERSPRPTHPPQRASQPGPSSEPAATQGRHRALQNLTPANP